MANEPSERLPLPALVTYPNFPFEGEMQVVEVKPYGDEEHPRNGEPGGDPCQTCAGEFGGHIWRDEVWGLRSLEPFTPFPAAYILETHEHLDFEDFDDDLAGQLGVLSVRITKAIQSIDDGAKGGDRQVGRVHVYRFGDGAEHFHMWFLARPFGAFQLTGLTMAMWGMTLPPIPPEISAANSAKVATHLGAWRGEALV